MDENGALKQQHLVEVQSLDENASSLKEEVMRLRNERKDSHKLQSEQVESQSGLIDQVNELKCRVASLLEINKRQSDTITSLNASNIESMKQIARLRKLILIRLIDLDFFQRLDAV